MRTITKAALLLCTATLATMLFALPDVSWSTGGALALDGEVNGQQLDVLWHVENVYFEWPYPPLEGTFSYTPGDGQLCLSYSITCIDGVNNPTCSLGVYIDGELILAHWHIDVGETISEDFCRPGPSAGTHTVRFGGTGTYFAAQATVYTNLPAPTPTPTSTPSATQAPMHTPTHTKTPVNSPTRTPTPTATTGTGPSRTPTRTSTRTPTGMRSPTPTRTPTRTPTGARSPTPTRTPTRTRTPTPGTKPVVQKVSPCIGGPFYYNGALFPVVTNRYEATVDWKGASPGYVEFSLNGNAVRETATGNRVSHTYNVARDLRFGSLGTTNELVVRAVTAGGVASEAFKMQFYGWDMPPWLPYTSLTVKLPPSCSGAPMKAGPAFAFPVPAFKGQVTLPSWLPSPLGGSAFGVKQTQASVVAELSGDGSASSTLSGQTGFSAGGQEILGRVYGNGKGTLKVGQNWKFDRQSFGLEVKGLIKLPIHLVDLLCKAVSGGTCELKQWESLPIVGGIVKWVNDTAKVQLKIEPGVDLRANFRCGDSGFQFESGTGKMKVKITLALILEAIKDFLSAEAYGGGEPSFTLQFPAAPSYLKELALQLFAGLKLKIWEFQRSTECTYRWSYSPAGGSAATVGDAVLVAASDWERIPRDYAKWHEPYDVFRANERPMRLAVGLEALAADATLLDTDERLIAGNVFPEGHPAIAANGSVMLLWVHDDTSKPLSQSKEIRYSVYDGSTWSTPSNITWDRAQDFAPQVAFDCKDQAVAVWERNKVLQFADSGLDAAYANAFEIAYAVWDGRNWSALSYLTDNGVLDHAPVLAQGADGTLLLVWRRNAGGELFATAQYPDTFFYSLWNGTSWSAPQPLLPNVVGVTALSAARHNGGNMAVAYSRDMDGNLASSTDQELFVMSWAGSAWTAASQLTNDAVSDQQPWLGYDGSGVPRLLWLKGDSLYALLGGFADTPRQVAVEESAGLLGYAAAGDRAGNLVLLWQGYSAEGVDLFYATYDQAHDVFSLEEQLTHDEAAEKFLSPTFAHGGEMLLAYNKSRLETGIVVVSPTLTISNVVHFGRTDLYMLRHTFGADLTIAPGTLIVTPTNAMPGSSVRVEATVHNAGDRAVPDAKVAFYLGNPSSGGTRVGTAALNLLLAGGMSTTVGIELTLPASGAPFAIHALADPDCQVTEANETNNSANTFAAAPDLRMVEVQVGYTAGAGVTLTAVIANDGAATSPATDVVFRLDDPEAGILAVSTRAPAVAAGAHAEVQIVWSTDGVVAGRYLVYGVVDPEGVLADSDESNNTDWAGLNLLPDMVLTEEDISVAPEPGGQLVLVTVANQGLREANHTLVALYDCIPAIGVAPLASTRMWVPVNQHRTVDLHLRDYTRPGFYVGVGFEESFDDLNPDDNVQLVGSMPNAVVLPLVLRGL